MRLPLLNAVGATHRRGLHALLARPFVDIDLRHDEIVDVGARFLVLGVCDRRAEKLLQILRARLLRELKDVQCLVDLLAAHEVRDELQKLVNGEVYINIQEIQRPELDSQLVAENIGTQLERRIAFRRAMKKAMESAFRFGAKGIKVRVSGRLNGAEIARTEWYQDGRLPLHTLKADIDYGRATAHTTYGTIGIKVWIYKGEMAKAKSRRRPQ